MKINYIILYIVLAFLLFQSQNSSASEPTYSVNPNLYLYSMTMTGVVEIEGVESYDANDVVYAFIDGECRGATLVKQVQQINRGLCFLMVYSNNPIGTISFKVYDSSEDKTYSLSQTASYSVNGVVGSVSSPYTFEAIGDVYEADLLSFSLANQIGTTTISEPKVYITMPYYTNYSSLIPVFQVSDGAVVTVDDQEIYSGTSSVDFSQTTRLMVESYDGRISKSYTIKLTREENSLKSLSFSNIMINENSKGVKVGDASVDFKYNASETFTCSDHNFHFIGNTLYVANDCLNYEESSTYTLRITVNDGYTDFYENVTFEIKDVNEAPTDISLSATSVDKTLDVDEIVAEITCEDEDVNSEFTYVLTDGFGDNSYFSVEKNQLFLEESLSDIENETVTLKIEVTDDGGLAYSEEISLTLSNSNTVPEILTKPTPYVVEGSAFVYAIACRDADGDELICTVGGLPSWLTFDQSLQIISGVPTSADLGEHSFTVFVNDGYQIVEQNIVLFVIEVNNAPVVQKQLEDVKFLADEANTYTIPNDLFFDADGDELSYEIEMNNGEDLPDWLTFDHQQMVLEGSPFAADIASYSLKLIATDASNLQASLLFMLNVQAIEALDTLSPILNIEIGTLTFDAEAMSEYLLPEDLFIDQSGGELAYSITLDDGSGIPNWLSLNNDSTMIVAEPQIADVGEYGISLIATNKLGLTVQQLITVIVKENRAPKFLSTAPVYAVEDELFIYSILYTDEDADETTIRVVDLPLWLVYNPDTDILLGRPVNDCVGACTFTIEASDGKAKTEQTVALTILNVNDAPTIKGTIEDVCFYINGTNSCSFDHLKIEDIDANDELSYAVKGVSSGNFDWLSFNDDAMSLEGEPKIDHLGNYVVELVATDKYGESASVIFNFEVAYATAADDFGFGTFKVYPNPAVDVINVMGLNFDQSSTYWICDLSGKQVIGFAGDLRKGHSIDVSQLVKGVYIFHVENSEGTYHQKIQITR